MTRLGAFWPITATVQMVTAVIVAAIIVASVIGVIVTAASWAMNARILVEAHFSFFSIDVLVGGRNHLANPYGRLTIELGAEIAVMESLDASEARLDACTVPWARLSRCKSTQLARLLGNENEIRFPRARLAWCMFRGRRCSRRCAQDARHCNQTASHSFFHSRSRIKVPTWTRLPAPI